VNTKKQERPNGYDYTRLMLDHIGGWGSVFNGELIYPRQLEIHLPGDGKRACNFNCYYCQGRLLKKPLGMDVGKVFGIIDELGGAVPLHVYGGAYTEPLLNPWFLSLLKSTKRHGSKFGIHTNGSLLMELQKSVGFIGELCSISDSEEDYISVSIDAGFPQSHTRSKGLDRNCFDEIIKGVALLCELRGAHIYPAVRFSYIANTMNSTRAELKNIVSIAKEIGVDSVRFSIPYDLYGKPFNKVRAYKKNCEIPWDQSLREKLGGILSTDTNRPFVFYIPPSCQDVDRMDFRQCVYSYYQITLAADGWMYNCSSTASPSFKFSRLGRQTDNIEEFNRMVMRSHNPRFDPSVCFRHGARCNRMGLEINLAWEERNGLRSK